LRAPKMHSRQPGRSTYTGSRSSLLSTLISQDDVSAATPLQPTHTLIVSRPSRTSSLVREMPDTLLARIDSLTATASNQPQRRARPVVAPFSLPTAARCAPTSSNSSVGRGPEPTRVV